MIDAQKRARPEWIGKTPDSAIPNAVRLRVFAAYDGRCWLSGRKIGPSDAWDMDHKIALCNGGEHRESNLAPALRDKHRGKTVEDVAERVKTERMRLKFIGAWPKSKTPIKSRGFASSRRQQYGAVVPRGERT